MLRVFTIAGLLSIASVRAIDVKKDFPAWPHKFSATVLKIDPYDSNPLKQGAGANGTSVKIWYDGDAGKIKFEIGNLTIYTLKEYSGGRGAWLQVDRSGCVINYNQEMVNDGIKYPMPPLPNIEFVDESVVEGEKVEQWTWKGMGFYKGNSTVNIYIKQQEGVAIPVKINVFPEVPPTGSDVILPIVIEYKDVSTAKPDASVFDVDASKCREITIVPPKSHKFI